MEDIDTLIEQVCFNEKGLIPAVLQDINTKEVLMVAYMNKESLQKTLETNKAWFWSRSREKLWLKGETSGNIQFVKEIKIDCDSDTLLIEVEPAGPACHTGKKSCFYRIFENGEIKEESQKENNADDSLLFLNRLYNIIKDRKENRPSDSYTTYLFNEGVDKIGKKIGEEAAEVIIASKNGSNDEITSESADLIYHLIVLLNLFDIKLDEVVDELKERHK